MLLKDLLTYLLTYLITYLLTYLLFFIREGLEKSKFFDQNSTRANIATAQQNLDLTLILIACPYNFCHRLKFFPKREHFKQNFTSLFCYVFTYKSKFHHEIRTRKLCYRKDDRAMRAI